MAKPQLLMCSPNYFAVNYVINEWMLTGLDQVNQSLAISQWNTLRDALSEYFDILPMDPVENLPDLVFTANAGFVIGNTVVVSNFRSPERQPESKFDEVFFQNNGFTIASWPKEIIFEGAGDALIDRKLPVIWAGYGFRSDVNSHGTLQNIFNREVVSLRLVDRHFYHLDTCFCPLSTGDLLYYPQAFDLDSQQKIVKYLGAKKLVPVSRDDALTFCCNAVNYENQIFFNAASQDLQTRLLKLGINSIITPMSEFMKAGGGSKCLTLRLQES